VFQKNSREILVHPASLPIEILLAECDIRTTRRSGPGGQHRNKVETAVIISHRPTGIVAEASERRSQVANRDVALHRLRLKLAVEHRSPAELPASASDLPLNGTVAVESFVPSERWSERVSKGRVAIAVDHADYPAMLAELFDRLSADQWNIARTANLFRTTGSQLVKVLRKHPPALLAMNQQRKLLGLAQFQ
jgi:hypothetical protein